MSDVAIVSLEGVRLARSASVRSAIVATTIGGAAALGVITTEHRSALALGCWALAVSTLVVARRSPRPERLASTAAWQRAGAGRAAIWMCAVAEALITGLLPALLGGGLAAVLSSATDSSSPHRSGASFLVWLSCGLALAACLPTSRPRKRNRSATRRVFFGASIAFRVAFVAIALVAIFGSVHTVRTDFDLTVVGFFALVLLVPVAAIVTGAALPWVVDGLGRIRRFRALVAIAARYRVPATVRLVIVASVTVAAVAAVLGASVEARPETNRLLAERLAHLPVLPANVALVRLDAKGLAALAAGSLRGLNPSELKQLRAAIADVVPDAQTIELRYVGAEASEILCLHCNNGPVIVADPRLRSIYGRDAEFPPPGAVTTGFLTPESEELGRSSLTRVQPPDVLAVDMFDRKPLPPASFAGTVYYETPPATVAALHLHPTTRSVFLRAAHPLTSVQLARLAAIARTWPTEANAQLTLIGPHGQLQPSAPRGVPDFVSNASLRHAPWAATSTAARWSLAVAAGIMALVALLVALAIDAIDRRRDVQRLERIGATPLQIRGAAAFHAAVLLGVVTSFTVALVVGLTRVGVESFNHAKPAIPVPFTVPIPLILLLTIGLPAAGAAVAALIARPTRLRRV